MITTLNEEAKAVVEHYTDSMLFYLSNYGDNRQTMEDIVNIFSEEYKKLFLKIASELTNYEKEEE